MPTTSRLLTAFAALVLALDGIAALALSATSMLFRTSVAAVEGRTGNPNDHLGWWAIGFLVLAVAAFVAAWRAAHHARTGRWLGMLVAGVGTVVAASVLWALATEATVDLGGLVLAALVLVAQVLVLVTLARWVPGVAERADTARKQSQVGDQ
jgi:hypothetical protein